MSQNADSGLLQHSPNGFRKGAYLGPVTRLGHCSAMAKIRAARLGSSSSIVSIAIPEHPPTPATRECRRLSQGDRRLARAPSQHAQENHSRAGNERQSHCDR